jgi:hypothetical protein
MNQAMTGRAVAALGVVLGVVAIFVDFTSTALGSVKYSDDGTILAFLLVTLVLTAVLLAGAIGGRDELDAYAAVTGSMAFGFFLFIPAGLGFNHFDLVGAGGWLGVCSGLIPLGLWYSLASRPRAVGRPGTPLVLVPIAGRILCLVAIWLTAESDVGVSYWNLADKGRALPALMLLLVLGGAVLGASTLGSPTSMAADGTLILAAITFGLFGAEVIASAFDEFGSLGAGAWLGAAGGLVLLIGVKLLWKSMSSEVPETAPVAATSPPPAA